MHPEFADFENYGLFSMYSFVNTILKSNVSKITSSFRCAPYSDTTRGHAKLRVQVKFISNFVSRLSYYWSIIRISNTTGGHNFSLELAQDAFYCSSCFDTNVP